MLILYDTLFRLGSELASRIENIPSFFVRRDHLSAVCTLTSMQIHSAELLKNESST